MNRLPIVSILHAVVIINLISCATSPLGRSQLAFMPDSDIDRMGARAFEVQKKNLPLSKDPRTNQIVQCVAKTLTRQVKGNWEVLVFQEKNPNAFALPSGKIGVHSGLLKVAKNQHQLAAVIGHEIGHVIAHHSNERVSQQFAADAGLSLAEALVGATVSPGTGQLLMGAMGLGAQYGVLMPFSRIQESEADLIGLDLMAKSGFDPRESVQLWRNMAAAGGGGPVEFLSTHPSSETRIQDLQKRMPKAMQLWQNARSHGQQPKC
ncbi:MAG: M48 family metallopeptidase [Gammaproteobacteria bacterium]